MVEYIDIEKLLQKSSRMTEYGKMSTYKPRSMNRNAAYKCSVCGKLCSSYYNDVREWKFCPNCGAKMDSEGVRDEQRKTD